MSSLGSLNILLSLDSIQFNQALDKSSYQTQKFAKQFELNFTKAQAKAKQFSERTTQYLNNIEKAANTINKTTSRTFWAGIVSSGGSYLSSGISDVIKYADSYTELQNRIRLVTNSQTAMVAATESVFDISLKTNQAVGATAQIYQRFAQNADRLNLSQLQVSELTETVAKSVAISGASAGAAEAALMQFGQALGSAELRGDELNSVIEQTPGLADAIAKGLGVTTGELKNLAKAGKLDIHTVIQALVKARDTVDNDFNKRVKTLSMSFTNLETSITKFSGEANSALGVTQKLATGVDFVSDHLQELIIGLGSLTAALAIGHLSKYGLELLKTGYASAKNALAHIAEAKAIATKATAMRTAAQVEMASLNAQFQLAQSEQTRFALRERMKVQSAQIIALAQAEATAKRNLATATNLATMAAKGLQSVMALLGGPAGVIGIAATSLIFFSSQAAQARQWALDTTTANQGLAESYNELSEAALSLKVEKQLEDIEKYYKEIEKAKASAKSKNINGDFDGFTVVNSISDKELEHLQNEIKSIEENASLAEKALVKMLAPLAENMLRSGKSLDDVRQKFKLLGIDAVTANNIIATLPKSFSDAANGAKNATDKTLDLKDAIDKLNGKSTTLAQKLEVAKLKQQGQAKSAYVLAGLYELLGKEGAEYNEVLIGIATGTITAANAADKAVGLSVETLNKIIAGKATLEKMFSDETKVTTIETQIKESHKKSGENARDSWLNFYDEIRKKNSSSLGEIELEQARMFQRLEEHNKKGVVSYQEYETAKTAIAERFARQRLELAGKYAPEKLLKANRDNELKSIQELYEKGQLNQSEAVKASTRVQFDYAQQVSQSAVDPLAQLRALYDPQQELINQQTQELAQLQSFNDQKLITEEEFQQRKQQIIEKYRNNQFQEQMGLYATGLNDLGNAFGTLTSIVEQSAGKQSAAYKAMFAISKAFAIAEATVKLSQAIAQALADPTALTPAQKFANMAAVASAGVNLVSQITSVGFATGGYTGDGGKYTPAGIVHKGEYVITKEATARLGRGFLDHLNYGSVRRGFANGGGVGVPRLPTMAYQPKSSGNIAVKVINNGEPMDATVSQQSKNGQLEITVELVRQIAQAEAGTMLQKNMRPGGLLS
ncbi:tape measure protein [Haemophilus influenzae]|uniref:Phage tail tape measure protein n=2 Tax=Gammaproteobacteria TaxID=1236 RepID=A0A3E1QF23_HAEIF|nr:tape measure protein [Haemophilus influenzae]AXP39490.1 phage tail tape measure protein [Haemophilus influenzae]MCK8901742.1 tape measure protein [Haemophilus influenzae]MCK8945326.1 tape measure protein [Haemophilus influenzae]MCK8987988.1 tape measure protein [Haemophilus influenzae]MCK9051902.1 tape measure protein [Haemophilus influenzae]